MQTSIHREHIEWCDIWIADGTGSPLPRVLLIGDSITRAYYDSVAEKLKGLASISRLTTSKSFGDPALLKEIALVLPQYPWSVIHFNNGLHGWDYSEDDYRNAYPDFIAATRELAPYAKLVLATTTPMYIGPDLTEFDPHTNRVLARNAIAVELAAEANIVVDDLFALTNGHPEFFSRDGVHFNPAGIAAQAEQVARHILSRL